MSKKSKTIICIEANAINRYIIKKLLESEGHIVHDAETKKAGLDLFRTVEPDLILIDLHMPGVDGYAITQHIRSIDGLTDVPIVALTTHVGIDGHNKAPISGCEGCIQKPIDAQVFVNHLSQFLS
jgi:two-component system cell cycle response regulator DivK